MLVRYSIWMFSLLTTMVVLHGIRELHVLVWMYMRESKLKRLLLRRW